MARPPKQGNPPDQIDPPVNFPNIPVTEDRPRDPAPRPPQVPDRPGPIPGTGGTPGSQLSPYMRGAYKYTTPGGHRYSLQMRPTASQTSVIDQIVDHGFSLSAPEETIAIAATTAFQESTFGDHITTSQSSALGVFQFTAPTWSDRYSHLNRESTADQVVAMYEQISYFRGRYSQHLAEGKIAGSMTFPEYAYANHKQGPYSPTTIATDPKTQEALGLFRDKWLILSLHIE
ncbi:MAG: hypothetical protein WBW32_01530 [Luteibacter sp.]